MRMKMQNNNPVRKASKLAPGGWLLVGTIVVTAAAYYVAQAQLTEGAMDALSYGFFQVGAWVLFALAVALALFGIVAFFLERLNLSRFAAPAILLAAFLAMFGYGTMALSNSFYEPDSTALP